MNVKFCSKCGEQINGEYKFCKKCGNSLMGNAPAAEARVPMKPASQVVKEGALDDEKTVLQSESFETPKTMPMNNGMMNGGTINQGPMNQAPINQGPINRQPTMQQPPSGNDGNVAKKIIMALIILLLLIVVGGVGYFTVSAIIESSQEGGSDDREDGEDEDIDDTTKNETDVKKAVEPDENNEKYADAVVNPEKHHYELAIGDITWTEAEKIAEEKGGYLACVTSADEEKDIIEYLSEEASELRVVFIGANNLTGEYKWVTGEGFSYEDWCTGEPNNSNDEEHYVAIYYADGSWGWNDTPDDMYQKYNGQFKGKCGYLIEYNE